jgi:hypothetical protein
MLRLNAITLALATVLCLAGPGASRAEQPQRPAPSAEQLAAWVRQLDADEFLTRETAMLGLVEAGPAALRVLEPALSTGNLETISRALFVLKQLGAKGDDATQEQAWDLLMKLAQRKESPVLARRAASIALEMTQERKLLALAELEAMGVKVTRSQFLGGLPLDESVLSIEVGDAFEGSDQDLRRLKWLQDVRVIVLSGQKATDSWVKEAAAMPSLEELHVYQARISETSLLALSEQPTLQQVGIYYTPVGDKVLESLAKLPLVRFVKLYGTQVSEKAAADFKAAEGNSRLDCRRGAFLGVGCMGLGNRCEISTVHDGSPAEKGGILRDDIIIRFGDTPVEGFDTLTSEISRRDVGEEVELELARRTIDEQGNQVIKNVVTKVKLVPWEMELAVRNAPRP